MRSRFCRQTYRGMVLALSRTLDRTRTSRDVASTSAAHKRVIPAASRSAAHQFIVYYQVPGVFTLDHIDRSTNTRPYL